MLDNRLEVIGPECEVPVVSVHWTSAEGPFRVHDEMYLQAATSKPCSIYRKCRSSNLLQVEDPAVERKRDFQISGYDRYVMQGKHLDVRPLGTSGAAITLAERAGRNHRKLAATFSRYVMI